MFQITRNYLLTPVVLLSMLTACTWYLYSATEIDLRTNVELSENNYSVIEEVPTCSGCIRNIVRKSDEKSIYKSGDREEGDHVRIKIMPGHYYISASFRSYKSARADFQHEEVQLKKGRKYLVDWSICYTPCDVLGYGPGPGDYKGAGMGYPATIWLEDKRTGDVVAGNRWD